MDALHDWPTHQLEKYLTDRDLPHTGELRPKIPAAAVMSDVTYSSNSNIIV